MELSIVSTLYKSESYVNEFLDRCKKSAECITQNFEIILVNDGSPDKSLALAREQMSKDQRIRLINLSRNFGHQSAIRIGLNEAKGQWVFLIDSDLEESPEWLFLFWQAKKKGEDVIYGVQKERKGNWLESISGYLYYQAVGILARYSIPPNVVTARLMSQEYVSSINTFHEKDTELWVLFSLAGYQQKKIEVYKGNKGSSTFTWKKKIQLLGAAITSSTNLPLNAICIIACGMWILSMLSTIYSHLIRSDKHFYVSFFCLGISTVCLFIGVVALYLAKIFNEVKNRPIAFKKQDIGH